MLLAILILQTAALVLIAVLALTGKLRGACGPIGRDGIPGPQGPKGDPATASAAVRSDLAQIMAYRHGEWHHHGWAQIASEAYHDAVKRQGWAVIRPGESIDLGEQG